MRDGGSTDGSVAILERYADRVPFVPEKDGGQADAINRGFRTATGEVMGWLNSDDVLLPGALKAVGEAFAKDPELVLVYGRAVYVDAEGKRLAPYLTAPWSRSVSRTSAFWRSPRRSGGAACSARWASSTPRSTTPWTTTTGCASPNATRTGRSCTSTASWPRRGSTATRSPSRGGTAGWTRSSGS